MPRLRMEALRKPVSRCNNSSPRRSVRTTMPLLLCRSFSGFHSQEISITLLIFQNVVMGLLPIQPQSYYFLRCKSIAWAKNMFGLALDIYIYTEPNKQINICWAKEKCPYRFFFSPAPISISIPTTERRKTRQKNRIKNN